MKSLEDIVVYIAVALVIASICWLTKEVLSLRKDMTKIQTETSLRISEIKENCSRHQMWSQDLQKSLGRLDRNLIRLCAKQNVKCEEPEDDEGNHIDLHI
jgi:hypothetical protein